MISDANLGKPDILIACIDGLKGFPDAINTVNLQAQIQLRICIWYVIQ